jgi:hypothetical protein
MAGCGVDRDGIALRGAGQFTGAPNFTDWSQTGAAWVIFQLFLTFITGALAIRNAFLLSIAGQQSLSWKWFTPLVSLWLVITFANMRLHHHLGTRQRGGNKLLSLYGCSERADDGDRDWLSAPHPHVISRP